MAVKQTAIALAAGLIFGAGLAVSGMADPQRVQAFLDLSGAWDPTLAFVMGGALIPMAIAWVVQRRMAAPVAASRFDLPGTNRIDPRLAIGGLIFGAGWGVGGLCPGPAIADLAIAPAPAAMFIAAMLAGMAVHRFAIR
ncbi:MAG: YeeE/YedE family protein [Blastomonas sp.]|nr:YeeE/YedE family protein [Blastomonas sp.]